MNCLLSWVEIVEEEKLKFKLKKFLKVILNIDNYFKFMCKLYHL